MRNPTLALGGAALMLCGWASAQTIPAWRIAVDVGHHWRAPGAISARGQSELSFNQHLAEQLASALEAHGMQVQLINRDGSLESLPARPRSAPDADLFVSIHHDSVEERELMPWTWAGHPQTYNDQWQGHSLFVSRRNPLPEASLLCASTMGARLQREGFTPTDKNARRRPWADQANTVHWYDNLVVLHQARQPAVLVEAGVIKNRDEELLLADPERQARMADALATGIAACLQVLHPPTPPTADVGRAP
ncbi:MAG: N-acetylmuramoyl-L-alanine amidase [Zoogloeaceae bacterium]|nr:N-acetylmuramoyl-L-alanine amidase [Zoogloeaceae bacterium]